jgi:hypothetical protein
VIYRTTDTDDIKRILSSDGVAQYTGWVDGFEPPITEDIHYLMVMDGAKKAGLWIFDPYEDGLKIHAGMLPAHRGDIAVSSVNEAMDYAFTLTDVIYAEVDEDLNNVIGFAQKVGFQPLAERNGRVLLEKRTGQ